MPRKYVQSETAMRNMAEGSQAKASRRRRTEAEIVAEGRTRRASPVNQVRAARPSDDDADEDTAEVQRSAAPRRHPLANWLASADKILTRKDDTA